MIRAYIDGNLEFYKDLDDLLYSLRTHHGIDLSEVDLINTEEIEDTLGKVRNSLDQLNYVAELEKLDELYMFIDEEKRMSKKNKEILNAIIRDIRSGLYEHVEAYRVEAMELLDAEI